MLSVEERVICQAIYAYHVNPELIFRTRKTGDLILCDFCQYYKCSWLNYSPSKYPEYCPEIREFWITERDIPKEDFMRRAFIAQQVGIYSSFDRSWHLCAMKSKNLTAVAIKEVMREISTWASDNKFVLNKMVEYVPSRDSRTTVQKKLSEILKKIL
jgi:hypothetical protein